MRKKYALILLSIASTFDLHAQWVQQKSGTTTELTDIAALDSSTAMAVGRDGSILKSTDAGTTWINLPLLPLFFHPWNALSFFDRMVGSVVGDFGRVATTTDAGEHWLWRAVPGGRTCLSVLSVVPAVIYVGDDSGWVHRSLDSGLTWASEHVSAWPIRCLFQWRGYSGDSNPIYVLTPYSLCSMKRFPPTPWTETILQPFQGLGSEAFRGEFCNGGGPGFIVGVQGDLRAAPAIVRWLMPDTTWRTVIPALWGNGTLFGVSAPSKYAIYACGDQGMIFKSTDQGDTWSAASVPTTQTLRAISFFDEKRGFAVGDSGTILYTSRGGSTAIGAEGGLLPLAFALYQNYPNPFNPTTTIKYTVGVASGRWQVAEEAGSRVSGPVLSGVEGLGARKTRLVVYDLLGRQVATLVDEVKAPGSYEVQFNGSNLSSGVYFYRMQSGDFVQTRRLLLLQ